MTLLTRLWESALDVVWAARSLIVLQMARDARGGRQVVVVVRVTIDALSWRHSVRSGQCKSGCRMIERRARPRRRVMTLLAGLRKPALRVVWVRSSLIILQVAGHTGRTCQVVVIVNVAIDALPRRNCM